MTEQLPKPRLIDRVIGPSPREAALEGQIESIEQAFRLFADKHENLLIDGTGGTVHEGLDGISRMLDEKGWHSIWEYDDDRGLSLRQLKEASKQIRELRVGNPFIGNAYRIRNAQTNGAGVEFSARLKNGNTRPLAARYRDLCDEPWAQRYLFGNKARGENESAAFSDGVALFVIRNSDNRTFRIQIQEIDGLLRNPNNHEEIFAYRRTWNPDPEGLDSEAKMRTRWYYTDAVPQADRRRRIKVRGGAVELAEPDHTLIDAHFNRQVGWALGVPDALCVVAWARLYKEFLVNGYVMSRSLARLAYKITVATAQGGQNAATTVATPGQSGSTYIEGSGNQLTPLANAGRGYDFSSGDALAAAIAAGLGVSLLALTGHTSAGSNASLQTLDPIAKATAAVRRKDWEDEYVRIFRQFGMRERLVTTWHDLPEDTLQRLMQAWTLVDNTELFTGEVMQSNIARAMGIADPGSVPTWWKPASERKSAGALSSTGGNAGATDGSGQGDGDRPDGASDDDHDDDTP